MNLVVDSKQKKEYVDFFLMYFFNYIPLILENNIEIEKLSDGDKLSIYFCIQFDRLGIIIQSYTILQ